MEYLIDLATLLFLLSNVLQDFAKGAASLYFLGSLAMLKFSGGGGYLVTTFTSSKRYSLVVFPPARQSNPPGKQSEDLTKTFNR